MTSSYVLPHETTRKLNELVESIETSPLSKVRPGELDPPDEPLNVNAVIDDLPTGLNENDLVGIISLSMLTECATDSYAEVFLDAAKHHSAPWLGRFTSNTWVPDEYNHTNPFKAMLLDMGFSEQELDASIKETLEKTYVHTTGKSPVELTTFGMIQEYLTDHWYGMLAKLIKRRAPQAALLATKVKRRETLHYVWYKEMSCIQVESDPGLLPLVAESVTSFTMPGGSLVPEYQNHVLQWMAGAGADLNYNAQQMVKHLFDIAGNSSRAGKLLTDVAISAGLNIGPVKATHIQGLIEKLGGRGYELLGEAVLESVGLPIASHNQTSQNRRILGTVPTPNAIYEKFRSKIRKSIANRIDLSTVHGGSF
ncbi:MAG: hypothetical protein CL889_05095 [Dehalococcoidia bacterium]|nr:hypothetical protein [Dehalococcoidia bacterium]|tara:strand:+ start:740 stop:1840 length:1101 start_codon:yes stop_codon:yes gene_type:complete